MNVLKLQINRGHIRASVGAGAEEKAHEFIGGSPDGVAGDLIRLAKRYECESYTVDGVMAPALSAALRVAGLDVDVAEESALD